ncbi:hypothetical protein Q0601_02220 [Paracoccus onubensis]|nr:hypothetical protein [Paracoccus onubensis]MDP0925978.1 hypothetical protein [Paracoccus onubensis]
MSIEPGMIVLISAPATDATYDDARMAAFRLIGQKGVVMPPA